MTSYDSVLKWIYAITRKRLLFRRKTKLYIFELYDIDSNIDKVQHFKLWKKITQLNKYVLKLDYRDASQQDVI